MCVTIICQTARTVVGSFRLLCLLGVITNNNWKTGVNVTALINRFQTSGVKCSTANFYPC